ncbi:hypothetical protein BC829DRAFT_402510 [Chytridium lagenaria]|nr:hypothetical protein BC829DRAFT_402510 [Chytridium lagenaria]
MLESMNLKEEYFVLGETSKSVSRCIIAQSMTSPRRKSESNVAVILVDRTYDLATPVSHSDNLIDQMRNVMGDGSMDVMIDSTAILPEWDQGGPATLSHGSDPDTMDLLTVLTMLGRKDGLVAVRKRIVDLIGRYVPDGRPKVLGKVTLEQLERLLRVLVDGSGGIGGSLLETVAGVVEGVREGQAVNWDELMAIERVIAMSVAEAPEASSVIAPIRDVVSQGLQRQSAGTSTPPHLRTGTPPHSPSPASSRLPSTASSYTGRSSTVEARNAGVGGGDKGFGEEEEMLVRDALVKAVMSDAGFGEQDSTSALWRKWRKDVDEWTNDCVRVLKRIMGGMQKTTSNPFSGSSPQGFQSLIRRIALEAAHTPSGVAGAGQTATGVSGMDELVHVPYGGLWDRRLLGGGNRLRPGHFSRVIIFVVGGMTCMEMRDVREAVREASGGLPAGGTQIMVGSTGLLSGVDVVRRLFPQVPRTLI